MFTFDIIEYFNGFSLFHSVCVILLGLFCGFIGTNTGGSSLLAIPALMFLGIPPQVAIATTRVAATGTMVAGIYQFHKNKKVDYRLGIPAALLSAIGAYFGSYLLLEIPNEHLRKFLGILNLIVISLMIWKNKGIEPTLTLIKWKRNMGHFLFFLTGFLGSFLAGGAIFFTFILVMFFGKTFSESAGTRKIAGITTSVVSVIIYALNGIIDFRYGFLLILCTFIGSYFGSNFGIKKGEAWLAKAFYTVVIASTIPMFF